MQLITCRLLSADNYLQLTKVFEQFAKTKTLIHGESDYE
ncbi:MAG: hypothetical protein ACI9BC_003151 [Crocinitomicaceae bacterium]|jgi:hypothetical protein